MRIFWFYSSKGITPLVIFTNRYYVRELSTDGHSYRRISQGFDNVVAFDIDNVEGKIYMVDAKARKIIRMTVNGSDMETIVKHDLPGGEGLAVDWVGRLDTADTCTMLKYIEIVTFIVQF